MPVPVPKWGINWNHYPPELNWRGELYLAWKYLLKSLRKCLIFTSPWASHRP